MGLDIALGLMILTAAVRGWFRGFFLQAIRLGGLVGAVYAAGPIRDQARPYVAEHLASVRPELLDRLLWWVAAVLTYVVGVGLITLVVRMRRRRAFGEMDPNRADQFAGFWLGGLKGAVAVAFIASGLHKYAVPRTQGIDWAEEQARGSYSLQWEEQYHPADRVWYSPPVQQFVAHVRRMGMNPTEGDTPGKGLSTADALIQSAVRGGPPRLGLGLPGDPEVPGLDPTSADFPRQFDRAWEALGGESKPKD